MSIEAKVPAPGRESMALQRGKQLFNEQQTFEESKKKAFRLKNDTVEKRTVLVIEGWAKVTHTGAAVIDQAGILRAINGITINDGKDLIKSINPFMARRRDHLINKRPPANRVGTGATKLAAFLAATECTITGAPFVMPATGQYIYFFTEIPIDYEDYLGYRTGLGLSLLDLRGKNSARLTVDCGALKAMHVDSYAGDAGYSELDIKMDLVSSEVPFVDAAPFKQFRESVYPVQIPAGARGFAIELSRSEGTILDLCFQVRGTDVNKTLSDTAIKRLMLKGEGIGEPIELDWTKLQSLNRNAEGPAYSEMNAGGHAFKGFAMANLRAFGISESGIRRNDLNSLILYVDSSGASDLVTETGNIVMDIAIAEMVNP